MGSPDKIKVTSDGTGVGTQITYKGERLPVKRLKLDIDGPDYFVVLSFETNLVEFDIEAYPGFATMIAPAIKRGI